MTKLNQALVAYKAALLETAAGDLVSRHIGQPQGKDAAQRCADCRVEVLKAAASVPSDQLVAALMESGFLQ